MRNPPCIPGLTDLPLMVGDEPPALRSPAVAMVGEASADMLGSGGSGGSIGKEAGCKAQRKEKSRRKRKVNDEYKKIRGCVQWE
jgi:hypothetical protein